MLYQLSYLATPGCWKTACATLNYIKSASSL
jgi:hypothetical protein